MERAVQALERFSDEDLVLMLGNARLKVQIEPLTELEHTLLRCWGQIRASRARRAAGGLVHEAALEQPKPLPLDTFLKLDSLQGVLCDPVTSARRIITYAEFLEDPELHLRFAAALLGPAARGKTPLAKSTAVYLALAYQQLVYKTSAARCFYVQANSIDTLRACGQLLKPYVPIFLDECEVADTRQQGALSENSVKVLCDVANGGTLRVRFGSIVFPPNCPRIFAANCDTAADWLEHLGSNPSHADAIQKRVIFFKVDRLLVPAGTARSSGLEDAAAVAAALKRARQEMR